MASSRGNPNLGDIVRSVAVMGLIVLGLWGIGQFFTTTPDQPTTSVDYSRTVREVRGAADYPVLAPPSLPEGWRATSARYEPNKQVWHLGVLTDDDEYLGLEQADVSVETAIDRWAEDSEAAGSASVADTVWEVRAGSNDRITYVARTGDVTTLVTTSGDQALLDSYVESLTSQ